MRHKMTFYALSSGFASVIAVLLYGQAPAVQNIQARVIPHESVSAPVVKAATAVREKPEWRRAIILWTPQLGVKGYKLHVGNAPGQYTRTIDVAKRNKYQFDGLPDGTYYFAVTSYDTKGNESPYSAEVMKTIPAKN
jgi:hypothetical protein